MEGAVKVPRSSEKSPVDRGWFITIFTSLNLERGRESRDLPEGNSRKGSHEPEAGEIPAAFHPIPHDDIRE